jgi:hypothetical protein
MLRVSTDDFTGEPYQTFKEEIMLVLHRLFQNVKEEGTHTSSSYKGRIILIQNQRLSGKKLVTRTPKILGPKLLN